MLGLCMIILAAIILIITFISNNTTTKNLDIALTKSIHQSKNVKQKKLNLYINSVNKNIQLITLDIKVNLYNFPYTNSIINCNGYLKPISIYNSLSDKDKLLIVLINNSDLLATIDINYTLIKGKYITITTIKSINNKNNNFHLGDYILSDFTDYLLYKYQDINVNKSDVISQVYNLLLNYNEDTIKDKNSMFKKLNSKLRVFNISKKDSLCAITGVKLTKEEYKESKACSNCNRLVSVYELIYTKGVCSSCNKSNFKPKEDLLKF